VTEKGAPVTDIFVAVQCICMQTFIHTYIHTYLLTYTTVAKRGVCR